LQIPAQSRKAKRGTRLAILALTLACAFTQGLNERRTSLDARIVAEWQHRINILKNQSDAKIVS
jgi:hypothetical protein